MMSVYPNNCTDDSEPATHDVFSHKNGLHISFLLAHLFDNLIDVVDQAVEVTLTPSALSLAHARNNR
jgi:hypothetical protein